MQIAEVFQEKWQNEKQTGESQQKRKYSIHRFYEPSLLALADHFHTIRSVSKDKMAMGKIEIKRFTLSELLQFNRSQLHSYLHVYIQSMLKQNSCVRNKTDIIYVKGFRFNQSTHFILCINYD